VPTHGGFFMSLPAPNTGIRIGLGFAECAAVENVTLPVVSSPDDYVGTIATTTNGTWTGPAVSYTYQWTRDGVPILGATSITYLIVLLDAGTVLNCGVIASNSCGDVSSEVFSAVGLDASRPQYAGQLARHFKQRNVDRQPRNLRVLVEAQWSIDRRRSRQLVYPSSRRHRHYDHSIRNREQYLYE
jgi:hypothetical protein